MSYHTNLEKLISDLRSGESRFNDACNFVFNDSLTSNILSDVVLRGGGIPKQYVPTPKSFIKFLCRFTAAEVELIDKASNETRSQTIDAEMDSCELSLIRQTIFEDDDESDVNGARFKPDTLGMEYQELETPEQQLTDDASKIFQNYIKMVARLYWSDELVTHPEKREQVIRKLNDNTSLRGILASKIRKYDNTVDLPFICNGGLSLVHQLMAKGKYKGGSIKAYFINVTFNYWRNLNRRVKLPSQPSTPMGNDHAVAVEDAHFGYDPYWNMVNKEFANTLLRTFKKLTKTCRHALYFTLKKARNVKTSRAVVAGETKYKNSGTLNNKVALCLKKWRASYEPKRTAQ